jgi:saccharopine dehydrogenase-like NADP-dependent oxidoreductase
MVADLVADGEFEVTAADASPMALERPAVAGAASRIQADLSDPATVTQLAADHDLVVGAVPGPLGFQTMKAVVEAGKHYVDISFFEEDAFELDAFAKENGAVALTDCGVAPGLSNLILGYHDATADHVDRFVCYVGGLPEERSGPFEYRAPFSPIDIIAEYTRPARYVEAGEIRIAPALAQLEQLEFPEVGTLEAFLTDGLRTLVDTVQVPDMREKTMRYPGHAERMLFLRELGLFSEEPIDVDGVMVAPIQLVSKLLFPFWRFKPGEGDLTVMRVEVDTVTAGESRHHVYDLLDRYDSSTDTQSMARTTGYTCTAMVRLVARGAYSEVGVSPPEYVGRVAGCFESVLADLQARGVSLVKSS